MSIEAGIAMPWHKYTGSFGRTISIEHYGASADAKTLFREYGFTPEAVVEAGIRAGAAVPGSPPGRNGRSSTRRTPSPSTW